MIQLKVYAVQTSAESMTNFVDARELHAKVETRQPFGLWFWSFRNGIPKLVEGVNILRRFGDRKQTLIIPEIANHLLMMSPGDQGHEFRRYVIEVADQDPAGAPAWLRQLFEIK